MFLPAIKIVILLDLWRYDEILDQQATLKSGYIEMQVNKSLGKQWKTSLKTSKNHFLHVN